MCKLKSDSAQKLKKTAAKLLQEFVDRNTRKSPAPARKKHKSGKGGAKKSGAKKGGAKKKGAKRARKPSSSKKPAKRPKVKKEDEDLDPAVDDPSQAKEEKDDLDDLDYQLLPVVDDPSKPDGRRVLTCHTITINMYCPYWIPYSH